MSDLRITSATVTPSGKSIVVALVEGRVTRCLRVPADQLDSVADIGGTVGGRADARD